MCFPQCLHVGSGLKKCGVFVNNFRTAADIDPNPGQGMNYIIKYVLFWKISDRLVYLSSVEVNSWVSAPWFHGPDSGPNDVVSGIL